MVEGELRRVTVTDGYGRRVTDERTGYAGYERTNGRTDGRRVMDETGYGE